ncbi:MAG: response regulator [Blastocatellia bacterium]|nr:response regulator [Blastocatellia bacterium]
MGRRILLADDSITIQKVVNLTFSDEGIDVVTVGNGELALRKLNDVRPDIVLADIYMPGRNGYEVCEYIKTNPQFSHIPVLLLVGAFEPFDQTEASRVKADGYLTKPFESRTLVATVNRLLAQVPVQPTLPSQAQQTWQVNSAESNIKLSPEVMSHFQIPTQNSPYPKAVPKASFIPASEVVEPPPVASPVVHKPEPLPDSISQPNAFTFEAKPTPPIFEEPLATPNQTSSEVKAPKFEFNFDYSEPIKPTTEKSFSLQPTEKLELPVTSEPKFLENDYADRNVAYEAEVASSLGIDYQQASDETSPLEIDVEPNLESSMDSSLESSLGSGLESSIEPELESSLETEVAPSQEQFVSSDQYEEDIMPLDLEPLDEIYENSGDAVLELASEQISDDQSSADTVHPIETEILFEPNTPSSLDLVEEPAAPAVSQPIMTETSAYDAVGDSLLTEPLPVQQAVEQIEKTVVEESTISEETQKRSTMEMVSLPDPQRPAFEDAETAIPSSEAPVLQHPSPASQDFVFELPPEPSEDLASQQTLSRAVEENPLILEEEQREERFSYSQQEEKQQSEVLIGESGLPNESRLIEERQTVETSVGQTSELFNAPVFELPPLVEETDEPYQMTKALAETKPSIPVVEEEKIEREEKEEQQDRTERLDRTVWPQPVEEDFEQVPGQSVEVVSQSVEVASVPVAEVPVVASHSLPSPVITTIDQIPQHLIDEIVRQAVAKMSEDVVRQIAWEVVPDLAEILIKKRLDQKPLG